MGSCQSQPFSCLKDPREDPQPPEPQYESMSIHFESESIYFKKLSATFRRKVELTSICYIPETELLLGFQFASKNFYIYNPRKNFKRIAVKRAEMEINDMIYSKDLKRIIVGGSVVQLWNPKTLKVEVQSPPLPDDSSAIDVAFLPSSDIFAVKTETSILISDKTLKAFTSFQLPDVSYERRSANFVSVSKDLLLAVCHHLNQRLFLFNLKSGAIKEYHQMIIPICNCVEMIQETPDNVFICLTSRKPHYYLNGCDYPFQLTQFTIDPETEELAITKMATEISFHLLKKLNNSKNFLAMKHHVMFLLSINKDHVEIIHVFSEEIPYYMPVPQLFIMLNDESSIISFNKRRRVGESLHLYRKEKSQKQEISIEGLMKILQKFLVIPL